MKVKCVKCLRVERFFTPGKVYKVKRGKITNDDGFTYSRETNTEVLEFLSRWYLFEKVKKDKTGVREVKRRAKKGEYVKIVDEFSSYGNYKNGDILRIVDGDRHVRYGHNTGEILYDSEYLVLEGYKPDEPKEPHKFKVGDIVKGDSESDERYHITNSNMTRGKVIRVSEDGTIRIKVLNHKTKPGEVGEEYVCTAKYFDLVEQSPKLYNGKIIFTKGDEIFKTGHIYKVKDGEISTEKYGLLPNGAPLKDIDDVKDYFTGNLDGNRKREKGWSPYTLELMEVKED